MHRIYEELVSLRSLVSDAKSISDSANIDSLAKKSLLLAAASYFEKQICDAIIEAANSRGSPLFVSEFIRRQALSRKYHTMFNWDAASLNSFFSLFGEEAKSNFIKAVEDDNQKGNIREFIYINGERNKLVHSNFASYSLEAVFEEIWTKFLAAKMFADWFRERLLLISGEVGIE